MLWPQFPFRRRVGHIRLRRYAPARCPALGTERDTDLVAGSTHLGIVAWIYLGSVGRRTVRIQTRVGVRSGTDADGVGPEKLG